MSKVALITDTHFGARDGRAIFHDYFQRFYSEVFFPTLTRMGITTVLHLGDLFDRRKYIDYYSLNRCRQYFFDELLRHDMEMYCLVGNHDIALRNTLELNSLELLLQEYSNIYPITAPTTIPVLDTKMLMMPWICSDNYQESMDAIKNATADICCGHFEISGFSMYKGMESHEGFDAGLFSKFDLVFSGHYHHRSSMGNISYIGNPYSITHMDYADPRGFHIFDTKTREIEFFQNPFDIFDRFVYDDSEGPPQVDTNRFKDKFVKIIVQRKTDFYSFDQFMDKVYNSGAHDIKVMESIHEMDAEEMEESMDIEDTQSILSHYIEKAEVDVDRTKLSKFIKELYIEAINTQV